MAEILFTNNASTTLFTTIDELATELTVSPGTGELFPTIHPDKEEHFRVTLLSNTGDFEIVKVIARVDDRFTIERAQEGTSAKSFEQNSIVELRLTAGGIKWLSSRIVELETLVNESTKIFTGATSYTNGSAGIVPAPKAGEEEKVLSASGEWIDVSDLSSIEDIKVDIKKAAFPVGTILPIFSDTAEGWLLCDGSEINRTTYSDLFNLIGTTFGEGNSSTTFNLPDFRDKFIQGANDNSGNYIEAGLPNITGVAHNLRVLSGGSFSESFYSTQKYTLSGFTGTEPNSVGGFTLDASKSSSVYGKSETVQPSAITVNIFIKY